MSSESAIIISILLLLGNAFFVAAEFSLITARRSAIETKAGKGSNRAKSVLSALENIPILIIGAQLGITICSLALGALSEPAIAHTIEPLLGGIHLSTHLKDIIALATAIILITILHVIIGEILPKNLSLSAPNRYALIFIPPLVYLTKLVAPIVKFINYLTQLILKIIGVNAKTEIISTYSSNELAELVRESISHGLINKDEKQLLSSALKFDKRTIKSVLIPINKLITIADNTTPAQLEVIVSKTGYSRFPVINKTGGFIGYLHIKDILDTKESRRQSPIPKKIIRPLICVYTDQSIRSVLKTMQKSGSHISLVNNNQDQIIGLVTLQDVLEEIVE